MSVNTQSKLRLARRLDDVSDSPTMAVSAEAQRLRAAGEDVVDFGAGEPDFSTPEHVKEAAHVAIRENFTRYTANAGIVELRKAIAARYRADYGIDFDASEILVTNGGKHALFNLMMTLLDPGDEAIIPNPHWMTFSEQVRLLGATPIFVETEEESQFRLTAERVARAVTPKTKVLVLCSPSNPAGSVVDESEFIAIGELARERGFFLLWDDTYGRMCFVPSPTRALQHLRKECASVFVIAGTASKTYAMTGWRLGWAMGPKAVVSGAGVLQSHSTSAASSISQKAALEALTASQDAVTMMRDEYRVRRDRSLEALATIPGVTCSRPDGAFYVFPHVASFFSPAITDSTEFAKELLKRERVAVVPGQAFGRDGYVRISIATSRERIDEGIHRIKRFLESSR